MKTEALENDLSESLDIEYRHTEVSTISNRHFVTIPFRDGLLRDLSSDQHPTKLYGWGHEGNGLLLPAGETHYGFVVQGDAKLSIPGLNGQERVYELQAGMYFALPNQGSLLGGKGIVISRVAFKGMFSIGGPIEQFGRLKYIDGCTDSLLIPPVIKGDACLNHLHFPKNISQTRHTHPSLRIGVVARGRGRCVVPENPDGSGKEVSIPLVPGQMFIIPTDGQHSFFTESSEMDVIAYHPDSDFGAEHDDHPMVNRTIVNGVSAARLDAIRTKVI